MPFRFALAPLLRLREGIERQRALHLREASLAVARAQEALVRIEQYLADSAASDQRGLITGRSAAELQFASVLQENLHRFRQQVQAEVRRLEVERQRVTEEYHRAYRDREVLESLRVSEHRAYQREEQRREQRELDTAHLLQVWRRRAD